MQYLKNALLVAIFALSGFVAEAVAPIHSIPAVTMTADAPQENIGVIDILQGLHRMRVEILDRGPVLLVVYNSEREIVYSRRVRPQLREISFPIGDYPNGNYTLVATSPTETEFVSFTIEN